MEASKIPEGVVSIRFLFLILPLIMGTVHCIWKKNIPHFAKVECFLFYFLTIGVGLQGILVGNLEIYHSDIVSAYVGWENSPFLVELGEAYLAFGLMGILSYWFEGGWRSATAFGYGLLSLMTSLGHYRYFIYNDHPHQAIMGPLIVSNLILALCLFALLILRRTINGR